VAPRSVQQWAAKARQAWQRRCSGRVSSPARLETFFGLCIGRCAGCCGCCITIPCDRFSAQPTWPFRWCATGRVQCLTRACRCRCGGADCWNRVLL